MLIAQSKLPVLLTLSVSLWLGSGCTDQTQPAVNTVHIAFDGRPTNAGPGFSDDKYSRALVLASYETLYEYRYLARPLELVPSLAVDWPEVSADGLIYTVTIAADARYSDDPAFKDGTGRSVVATDVAYSLLRHFDPETKAQGESQWRESIVGITEWDGDYNNYPAGIEVLDDHRIRFTLNAPSPRFLHTLATSDAAIVPPEADRFYGQELARHSVGSGPYLLESFDPTQAVLIENPNYRERLFDLEQVGFDSVVHDQRIAGFQGRRLPLIGNIIVSFLPQMNNRWLGFDNGRVDIAPINDTFLEKFNAGELQLNNNGDSVRQPKLHHSEGAEVILLRINMDDPGLGAHGDSDSDEGHRLLRCALRDAVDLKSRNTSFFGGNALVIGGVVAPSLPEFGADQKVDQRGQPTASQVDFRSMADELPVIKYGFTKGTVNQQNFDLFKSDLARAGYPDKLIEPAIYAAFGDYIKGAKENNHQISLVGWTLSYPDVENNLQLFYGPNGPNGVNLGNYQNPEYDRLYELVRDMPHSDHRTALVDQMQEMLRHDCAYIGSLSPRRYLMAQKRIVGLPDHSAAMNGRYFQFIGTEN